MRRRAVWTVALSAALLLSALPAFAAGDVIWSGADMWKTSKTGLTHTNFAKEPIPSGFFCPEASAFTGKISFGGSPLPAEPADALEGADTIVHRLDEASFDPSGEAVTRIRLLALWLRSKEPVDVGCDRPYDVDVVLDGEQPTTKMRIVRETKYGGFYVSPLALNVKVRFTPVGGGISERLEVDRQIALGPGSWSVWSYQDGDRGLLARVDTDGDGEVDTLVPTRGNFRAGVAPAQLGGGGTVQYCPYESCHCAQLSTDPFEDPTGCEDDHLHCNEVWVDCCELVKRGLPTNSSEPIACAFEEGGTSL